jgi:hypothetical protein
MVQEALNESRRHKEAVLPEIMAGFSRLQDRVRAEGLEVKYSPDEDYLRITIGKPRESVAVSLRDGLYFVLLYDPDTFETNAFEVPFFTERLEKAQPKADFWRLIAELLDRMGPHVYIPPLEETKRAERALRDLVLA